MKAHIARSAGLFAAAALLAGSVAGCSPRNEVPSTAEAKQAATVTVSDQWVKAADTGMTALFGTLHNSGATDATVVSATSPAAGSVELHEVVGQPGSTTMRPKAGGFSIPAGGSHLLAPGGDHIMLMNLTKPLQIGNDVEVTLSFADGSTLPLTAQVREFAGAGENYKPGGQPSSSPAQHSGGHSAGDHG